MIYAPLSGEDEFLRCTALNSFHHYFTRPSRLCAAVNQSPSWETQMYNNVLASVGGSGGAMTAEALRSVHPRGRAGSGSHGWPRSAQLPPSSRHRRVTLLNTQTEHTPEYQWFSSQMTKQPQPVD